MKVTVLKNGPLRVEGEDIQIQDPAGNAYGLAGRNVVSLCGCGQSANKPFCDGSHNHHGFQDDPQARDLPAKKVLMLKELSPLLPPPLPVAAQGPSADWRTLE